MTQNAVQLAYSAPLWLVRPRAPVLSADFTPATRAVARRGETLAAEARQLLDVAAIRPVQSVDRAQRRFNRDDGWRVLIFRIYGRDVPSALGLAPELASVLAAHPEIVSAALSVLAPGKHIPLHPGTLKGVVRAHLGVQVPQGACWMVVAGRRCEWQEGELLVFDDTYLHRVRNDTDEPRAVLLLEVVRPLPRPWLVALNARMIAWLGRRARVDAIVDAPAPEMAQPQ